MARTAAHPPAHVDTRTVLRHWPGDERYRVDTSGSVYGPRDRLMHPTMNSGGYLRVQIHSGDGMRRWAMVAHMVLETFVGSRPEGAVSRHLDGNKTNNAAGNLAWGTQQENIDDKRLHDTNTVGERHPQARLTTSIVRDIRSSHAAGESTSALAERYGVRPNHITDIVARRYWKQVS